MAGSPARTSSPDTLLPGAPARKNGGMDIAAWLLDSDPSLRWQVMRDVPEGKPSPWNTLSVLRWAGFAGA